MVDEAKGGVDRRGDGQEGWVMGFGGKEGGGWVIFCSQDWPAGVDLYSIKSDNQLSVKGIVLSCATEDLKQVQIHPWTVCFINY